MIPIVTNNKIYFLNSLGTGIRKIWYRKKVSEPVSEKFGTGADFCCQNFGIQKISNGYRNRYREFFIFSGGIGTGIGKIWYRKKVSEPVSVKFGIGKKSRNRYRKNLVPKKVPVSLSKIFGTGIKYRYRYHSTF